MKSKLFLGLLLVGVALVGTVACKDKDDYNEVETDTPVIVVPEETEVEEPLIDEADIDEAEQEIEEEAMETEEEMENYGEDLEQKF